MLVFNSFQARLTLFIVSLLIFSLTATLIAVNKVSIQNTNNEINNSLQISAGVFNDQLTQNQDKLFEIARLLSSDYAFKSAYSTHDHNTILSAMENHLSRINGENIMMLVSLEGKVIAHTLTPKIKGSDNPWPQLQSLAENSEYGEATSIIIVDNLPYQIMVVPLLIPNIDAWIYIGFPIDDNFVNKINKITRTDVTITHALKNVSTMISGSTLNVGRAKQLKSFLQNRTITFGENITINILNQDYISLPIKLNTINNVTLTAILQRSLSDALKGYNQLRDILYIIFTISLIISVILAFFIARQVTHPVKLLRQGAEFIEEGNYDQNINVKRSDEIGMLAHSFNNMAKGLKEKEKVRNLLGKVVSPAIAEELMSKDIELGGEEKFVTTLFSDVRNFTSMCEGRKPEEILSLLNEYFTKISGKIEDNDGVVDKYIGDAVMAIFGAPLRKEDDATRAIKSSFEMCHALKLLNESFKERGIPPIGIGIGIHSDIVVAGNMGSINRLNYTVIGDGVNLASRLEGLTKTYGLDIIVSDATANIATEFLYRELDLVKVKGKNNSCVILEPLGAIGHISDDIIKSLEKYQNALTLYRSSKWDEAKNEFEILFKAQPTSTLYQLYVTRCEEMKNNPPDNDWDGSYTFTNK